MAQLKDFTKETYGDENQQINKDLQDSKTIAKDFHFEVTIEDHDNEESLEPVVQVHHIPTREPKIPKRLEDFVIMVEFANIVNSLGDLVTFT